MTVTGSSITMQKPSIVNPEHCVVMVSELEFDATTQPISMVRLPLESPCDPLQCYCIYNLIGNEGGWFCCMGVKDGGWWLVCNDDYCYSSGLLDWLVWLVWMVVMVFGEGLVMV